MNKLSAAFLIYLAFAPGGHATQATVVSNPPPASLTVQASETVAPQTERAQSPKILTYDELIAGQLEILKRGNDQLLRTIHWTLGAVVTIAVLLVGYNWFSTFKTFDREKASLKEEIVNQFEERQAPFQNEMTKLINSSTAKLAESQNSFTAEVSSKINDAIRAADKRFAALRTQFAALETKTQQTLHAFRKEFDDQVRTSVKNAISEVDARLTSLFRAELEKSHEANREAVKRLAGELDSVKMEMLRGQFGYEFGEGTDYQTQGNLNMAQLCFLNSLEKAVDIPSAFEFLQKSALSALIQVLERGAKVADFEKQTLKGLAPRIASEFRRDFAKVQSLFDKAERWDVS